MELLLYQNISTLCSFCFIPFLTFYIFSSFSINVIENLALIFPNKKMLSLFNFFLSVILFPADSPTLECNKLFFVNNCELMMTYSCLNDTMDEDGVNKINSGENSVESFKFLDSKVEKFSFHWWMIEKQKGAELLRKWTLDG